MAFACCGSDDLRTTTFTENFVRKATKERESLIVFDDLDGDPSVVGVVYTLAKIAKVPVATRRPLHIVLCFSIEDGFPDDVIPRTLKASCLLLSLQRASDHEICRLLLRECDERTDGKVNMSYFAALTVATEASGDVRQALVVTEANAHNVLYRLDKIPKTKKRIRPEFIRLHSGFRCTDGFAPMGARDAVTLFVKGSGHDSIRASLDAEGVSWAEEFLAKMQLTGAGSEELSEAMSVADLFVPKATRDPEEEVREDETDLRYEDVSTTSLPLSQLIIAPLLALNGPFHTGRRVKKRKNFTYN